jgi:hypothetical protein
MRVMASDTTAIQDAPIMLRADITRDELAALKVAAIHAGMTTQQFLAYLIRQRLADDAKDD